MPGNPVFLVLAACLAIGGALADPPPEQTLGLFQNTPDAGPGYTLFPPGCSSTTYLVDNNGLLVHAWPSEGTPGLMAYLLENGLLLRADSVGNGSFDGGGGGRIKKIDWEGNTVWSYTYSSPQRLQHHDLEILPNGNVLFIAWELKTYQQAVAAGRNPWLLTGGGLWPDHLVEVRPTGPETGKIVWEWHLWDHLIQDHDPSRANYGVVADHPELIDINYTTVWSNPDWTHTNSVRYHPAFDEILISVREFHEVWVIDHSTTTAQARGHSGGRHGKGGDLLYRWGNPAAYRRGTAADQKLFRQHDAQWIPPGLPGAGDIMVFNNGRERPLEYYSTVDQFTPPADANGDFPLEPGQAYGPPSLSWSYAATPPAGFYSDIAGGAHRLPNGDTLICNAVAGTFFEVKPTGERVWKYVNPVGSAGPAEQGTTHDCPYVFKVRRYSPSYPGLAGRDLNPGCTIETGTECPMTAGISVTPSSPSEGSPVTFTATASGGKHPYTYTWDLGGQAASGFTVTRSFAAGSYTIGLTVTDATAREAGASQPLTVAPLPGPPRVADGKSAGWPASFSRNPSIPGRIDVVFDAASCSAPQAAILYGDLVDFSGYRGCAQAAAGNTGSATIDAPALGNVWFNIIWTDGATGGHPGFGHGGAGDVPRTWNAAGFCGITDDDHTTSSCP